METTEECILADTTACAVGSRTEFSLHLRDIETNERGLFVLQYIIVGCADASVCLLRHWPSSISTPTSSIQP